MRKFTFQVRRADRSVFELSLEEAEAAIERGSESRFTCVCGCGRELPAWLMVNQSLKETGGIAGPLTQDCAVMLRRSGVAENFFRFSITLLTSIKGYKAYVEREQQRVKSRVDSYREAMGLAGASAMTQPLREGTNGAALAAAREMLEADRRPDAAPDPERNGRRIRRRTHRGDADVRGGRRQSKRAAVEDAVAAETES